MRKLDHSKLRTKDENGKATDEGMKLLLKCLHDSLAQEAPVRTQELFLEYFYSPQVWRKNYVSMAQYIIRRELARESSAEIQLRLNKNFHQLVEGFMVKHTRSTGHSLLPQ